MAQSDYVPVSWNGEPVTNDKLNQMANNDQFLFDRTPLVRYSLTDNKSGNILRDNSIKIISGKTPYTSDNSSRDYLNVSVYFGSFFSTGCRPVVVAVVGDSAYGLRKFVTVNGFSGEIDHTGFTAHVSAHEPGGYPANQLITSGWIHWMATGY